MVNISEKLRDKLALKGKAMPDGSYPIRNVEDLKNAIQAFGRAKDKEAVMAFIKKRAKELNAEELIPENWLEKAKKGTPEYEEWLRQYHEKRRKKQEESAAERKKAAENEQAEKERKAKVSRAKFNLLRVKDAEEAVIGSNTYTKEQLSEEAVLEEIVKKHGQDFSAFDKKKLNESKPVKLVDKDWQRMVADAFSKNSAASTIKSKDKAIARAVAGMKLAGEPDVPTSEYALDDFGKQALRLGATLEDLKASFDAAGDVPEKFKAMSKSMTDHHYNDRFFGNIARALDREDIDWKFVHSGDSLTQAGQDAMRRSGLKWSIGYTIEVTDGTETKRYSFDAITDEGDGPTKYSLYGQAIGQKELIRSLISKINRDFGSLEKAKKGTPEYDEWLRKYREKRGLKPKEDEAKSRRLKVEDVFDSKVKEAAKQLDLFPEKEPEEVDGVPNIVKSLVPEEDVRVLKDVSRAKANVRMHPDLLAATQRPVFANMFGHYPVLPLDHIQDRVVTSAVEQVDVALADEPDYIEDAILDSDEWIATEKVDGCRATLICTPEATRITARRQQYSDKPSTDYTNNLPHIRDLDLYAILGDTIIDSESVASNPIETSPGVFGDSLASTMSVLGQEKDLNICVEKMRKFGPIVQFCFDIQRFKGQDLRSLPYAERMKYLDEAMELLRPYSSLIKRVATQNQGETKKEFFSRVTADDGEGCVLAKADGPYIAFDRKNRLKMKRKVELTLEIMSVEEGKGRNKGSAGAFILGARINGQLVSICNLNVGSDTLRKEAFEHPDQFIGKCVEVSSMQMTMGSGKDGLPRLRHPRWKTPGQLRLDKEMPDDLSDVVATLRRRREGKKE